jgi:hypothetical protein
MTDKQITIQVSARIYWGYKCQVPAYKVRKENEDMLIKYLKLNMSNFFKINDLTDLAEGVDKLELHLHLPENEDVPDIIYACDHTH